MELALYAFKVEGKTFGFELLLRMAITHTHPHPTPPQDTSPLGVIVICFSNGDYIPSSLLDRSFPKREAELIKNPFGMYRRLIFCVKPY